MGIAHVGTARSVEEERRPALLAAAGATVAQLAYTYGTNGRPVPEDRPWTVSLISHRRIIADARAARAAGADVIVVSLHWSTGSRAAPDRHQRALADRLTRAESGGQRAIDLVLGTHGQVPQAYEKVNGTWVVYGMGDQLAGAGDGDGDRSSIARFTFAPPARSAGRAVDGAAGGVHPAVGDRTGGERSDPNRQPQRSPAPRSGA